MSRVRHFKEHWKKWRRKVKRRKASRKKARAEARAAKKTEFSKKLAAWAVCVATLSVIASYVLAALGCETVSDVTVAVFTGCIGYLITYAGKSLGEKMSRNKHGLDADGNPYTPPSTAPEDEAPLDMDTTGNADL